jgi:uncharacterized protein
MNRKEIINEIETFAQESTMGFDSGHDWWHLQRVRNLALSLQVEENTGDPFIIELAALLHDVDDRKFRKTGDPSAAHIITELLHKLGVEEKIVNEVVRINKYISFSSGTKNEAASPEFYIVQDADRLDAIGAIGIARAFNYGGFRNNAIYIPINKKGEMEPSTIGHFHDKLLKLKDLMNTLGGKKLAEKRHLFLEKFLFEFYSEWNINGKRSPF